MQVRTTILFNRGAARQLKLFLKEGGKLMKRHVFWIAALCAVALAAAIGFIIRGPQNFTIVQLQGVSSGQNLSHQEWSIFHKRGDRPPLMPTQDGDTLYLLLKAGKAELEFITTYSSRDGQNPAFESRGAVLYLGGKPVSLTIAPDAPKQAWEWLSTAKPNELKSLRFLYLKFEDREISPGEMTLLQKVASVNPNVGLLLGNKQIQAVLPLFQPAQLILADPVMAEEISILKQQRSLRTLWLSLNTSGSGQTDLADLQFLSGISGLERLNLEVNKEIVFPSDQNFLPGNLRALRLSGFTIENLSFLKRFEHLRELSLASCKIKDITALAELPSLTALDLPGSEGVPDPSFFRHLPELQYFGTPPAKDQKKMIASLQALRHLQLLHVSYPEVSDFKGLEQLRSLRGLIITGRAEKDVKFQTQSLYGLKQLRYLALDNKLVEDPNEWAALEKALPDCRIAEVEGVCMGTGWILLLIPAILTAMLMVIIRRRHSSGPGGVPTP